MTPDEQIQAVISIIEERVRGLEGVNMGLVRRRVAGLHQDEQLRQLVGTLYSGLAYGNWPRRTG